MALYLINRWSKSLLFKMFLHKRNSLQLKKKQFFQFLVQQKLALVITNARNALPYQRTMFAAIILI